MTFFGKTNPYTEKTKVKNINKYLQAIDKILEVYSKLDSYYIKNSLAGTILELYMQYIYNLLRFSYSSSERKLLKNRISMIKKILINHDLNYIVKNYPLKKKIIYNFFIKRKK